MMERRWLINAFFCATLRSLLADGEEEEDGEDDDEDEDEEEDGR